MSKEREKKDVNPQEVETTETRQDAIDKMNNQTDSSQAQSTRKDSREAQKYDQTPAEEKDKKEENQTEDQGPSLDELPELTRDEDTVKKEEGDHRYPGNINTGPVDDSK